MRIIDSSVEIIPQESGVTGIYKMIELAGRTAYKSEDKISDTSYQRFLHKIRTLHHFSPFEHGTVYMMLNAKENKADFDFLYLLLNNKPWVRMSYDYNENFYITTNYRTILEHKLEHLYNKYKSKIWWV